MSTTGTPSYHNSNDRTQAVGPHRREESPRKWWAQVAARLHAGFLSHDFQRLAHARNRVDRRGYRVHLVCAIVGLIGILAADGVAEWLVALPVCAVLIRWLATYRSMADAVARPVSVSVVAAGLWGLLSLSWSSDVMNGLDELSSFRHALLVPALWPLRDHRGILIAALAAGFGLGHLSQLAHAVGVQADIAWLRSPRLPDRNSGWWDPVVGGTLLTAAVGLHLPAAMWGRGRARWVGAIGLCAAIGGIVATGTRGAWIASAALIALAGACALTRALWTSRSRTPGHAPRRRTTLIIAAALVVAVIGGGILAGPAVLARAGRGVQEVRRVIDERDYASDTGRRLFMWVESWRAATRSPVQGVGAGGLADFARPRAQTVGLDPELVLPHAHGMWVHLAATQGVIGVAAWALVCGGALASGCVVATRLGRIPRRPSRSPAADLRGHLRAAYQLAPVWALAGLALAGMFDSVHLNSQTAMVLMALVALCAMGRRDASLA